jgi:DNA-binding MarR family transcriptional regulator
MDHREERPSGAAFLLAQLGAHAAARFAQRLAELDLAPPAAGVLRMIAAQPGLSQQELAERVGLYPSRMVALLDDLSTKGLVERVRRATDRRVYEVKLSEAGRQMLGRVGAVSREHDETLGAALTPDERRTLAGLLQRVADEQGLTRRVHPGYREL